MTIRMYESHRRKVDTEEVFTVKTAEPTAPHQGTLIQM